MLRPRLSTRALSEAAGNRPRWLTNGVVNLAVLCALIVLVGMLSPRLSRTGAGIAFFAGLAVFALAASFFVGATRRLDRKSTRLNSSHQIISYAVFCLKKKKKQRTIILLQIDLR